MEILQIIAIALSSFSLGLSIANLIWESFNNKNYEKDISCEIDYAAKSDEVVVENNKDIVKNLCKYMPNELAEIYFNLHSFKWDYRLGKQPHNQFKYMKEIRKLTGEYTLSKYLWCEKTKHFTDDVFDNWWREGRPIDKLSNRYGNNDSRDESQYTNSQSKPSD